jgi:hypothetical protein
MASLHVIRLPLSCCYMFQLSIVSVSLLVHSRNGNHELVSQVIICVEHLRLYTWLVQTKCSSDGHTLAPISVSGDSLFISDDPCRIAARNETQKRNGDR